MGQSGKFEANAVDKVATTSAQNAAQIVRAKEIGRVEEMSHRWNDEEEDGWKGVVSMKQEGISIK